MEKTVTSRGLTAGSLYKVLLIGHAFSLGLLLICMGVFSLFGYETVHVEGLPAVGLQGLLAASIAAALFSVVFAFLNWIFIFTGNWLFTRFRAYDIVIHEAESPENKVRPAHFNDRR